MTKSKNEIEKVKEIAVKSIMESGVINKDARLADILKATNRFDTGTVSWTAVYDSDGWFLVVP